MPAITPEFMFDLESNMRMVATNSYEKLNANSWWERVAKRMATSSKKERINWLLDTARIERPNAKNGGGQQIFEDIVSETTEFTVENAIAGLKLKKEQLEDLDGNGVRLATHWSKNIGAYAAYWPQREVASLIKANPVTYDGLALFHGSHPVNPFDASAGTFANVFTGAASGAYPGALPIHDGVTAEIALNNIAKAIAYIASIKMPSGVDPRGLRVTKMLVPPRLMARAVQLTSAKTLVQSATSGALTADVEAVIRYLGLAEPIQCDELGLAFGGSDQAFYLLAEEVTSDELGAVVYVDREPFTTNYHGPMTSAELARKREFEWTCEGRNAVEPGHPYLIFRCDPT